MLSLLLKLYTVQGLFVKYERAAGALSNRPQVSMVYRLMNHLGCW